MQDFGSCLQLCMILLYACMCAPWFLNIAPWSCIAMIVLIYCSHSMQWAFSLGAPGSRTSSKNFETFCGCMRFGSMMLSCRILGMQAILILMSGVGLFLRIAPRCCSELAHQNRQISKLDGRDCCPWRLCLWRRLNWPGLGGKEWQPLTREGQPRRILALDTTARTFVKYFR